MGDQAKEFIKIAVMNMSKGLAVLALDFDLSLNKDAFKEKLLAIGTTVLLKSNPHRWT